MRRNAMWAVWAGVLLGATGSLLAYEGNPVNTGICISCFLENAAGALGFHSNPRMQYIRPELLGFLLGSAGSALLRREFKARFQSVGIHLFGFGVLMAVGSAVFIGCPIKVVLRLAAGDLTAVSGLAGLFGGVALGLRFLRTSDMGLGGPSRSAPIQIPLGMLAAILALAALTFVPGALIESRAGGGSIHAPPGLSLAAGLLLGVVCQRTRFCITGSVRDLLLTRSPWPALALLAALASAMVANGFTGQFSLGYHDQPGAHVEWAWSALGMGLVGVTAVIAGGCPFRQIIRSGEGDLDAATVVAGMVFGAALVQNWGLGATTAGVPAAGRVAVLLGLAAVGSLALIRKEQLT